MKTVVIVLPGIATCGWVTHCCIVALSTNSTNVLHILIRHVRETVDLEELWRVE